MSAMSVRTSEQLVWVQITNCWLKLGYLAYFMAKYNSRSIKKSTVSRGPCELLHPCVNPRNIKNCVCQNDAGEDNSKCVLSVWDIPKGESVPLMCQAWLDKTRPYQFSSTMVSCARNRKQREQQSALLVEWKEAEEARKQRNKEKKVAYQEQLALWTEELKKQAKQEKQQVEWKNIERWGSAQGLACRKGRVGDL